MRKRHDLGARRQIVERWKRSGLGMKAFARQAGVSYSSLCRWRREFRVAAYPATTAFVEVVACDTSSPADPAGAAGIDPSLEIVLAAGIVVRVGHDVDEALLRRVVRALG